MFLRLIREMENLLCSSSSSSSSGTSRRLPVRALVGRPQRADLEKHCHACKTPQLLRRFAGLTGQHGQEALQGQQEQCAWHLVFCTANAAQEG